MSYNERLITSQIDKDSQREQELRDHFAGLAMNGELSREGYVEYSEKYCDHDDLARKSYEIADAMLKARKETKSHKE